MHEFEEITVYAVVHCPDKKGFKVEKRGPATLPVSRTNGLARNRRKAL